MLNSQRFPFVEARDALGYWCSTAVTSDSVLSKFCCRSFRVIRHKLCQCLALQCRFNLEPFGETTSVQLAGNLAPVEARGLAIFCSVSDFAPVRLVLLGAWRTMYLTTSGWISFRIWCVFYRAQRAFDLRPKSWATCLIYWLKFSSECSLK